MKKNVLLLLLAVVSVVLLHGQTTWDGTSSSWTKGSGMKNDPYLIESVQHLAYLAESVNGGAGYSDKYFKLTSNLDLGGAASSNPRLQWIPIGTNKNQPFNGSFDGGGYEISNMYVNQPTVDYAGLFGYVDDKGNISNLGIGTGSSVLGNGYVGGVAGRCYIVTNCYNRSAVLGNGRYTGGVVGYSSSILDCYNMGSVSGSIDVGGISGYCSSIINCYNTGNISNSRSSYLGGISGVAHFASGCYNSGNVLGSGPIGGIMGIGSTIISCYNSGSISGSGINVGGIRGTASGTITNCYKLENKITINGGISWGNGNEYGVVKSSQEMKDEEFATLMNYYSNSFIFDSEDINGGYPILYYQSNLIKWIDRAAVSFAGGDGSQATPYLISTTEQLALLAKSVYEGTNYLNVYFRLQNNLNLKGISIDGEVWQWTPIGSVSNKFYGNLDGGGYEINNMYVNQPNSNYIGLFGYVDGGSVSNLGIGSSNSVYGKEYVGGVSGQSYSCSIINCYNAGVVLGNGNNVGGVLGYSAFAPIVNCYNSGSVYGDRMVGGISGYSSSSYSYSSSISNCYNIGSVYGNSTDIGGISGYSSSASIDNCYNNGSVSGSGTVGGISGMSSSTSIINCYNGGSVSGGSNAGGISGDSYASSIANCYNIGNIVGISNVGGISGDSRTSTSITNCYKLENTITLNGGISWGNGNEFAVVKNSQEMKSLDFVGLLNSYSNSWFFDSKNINVGYPILYMKLNVTKWIDKAATSFAGGDGSQSTPYLISTAEQFALLAKSVNEGNRYSDKYFKLVNNLDFKGTTIDGEIWQWTPIGNGSKRFYGKFDGGGNEVSNMYVNQPSIDYAGLFGYTKENISNLGIGIGSSVAGKSYVGGISGYSDSSIDNCYNTGNIFGNGNIVGGVSGYNSSITNCYNTSWVSGNNNVGGVSGYSRSVRNCYNIGIISGNNSNIGGINGTSSQTINDSYTLENIVTVDGGISWGNGNGYGEVRNSDEMKNDEFVSLLNGTQVMKHWISDFKNIPINNGYPILSWSACIITVNANGNGTATGSGAYESNTTVTLVATADEHYHFVKWSDENTDNPRTVIVTDDATYTAIFEPDHYTVTVNTSVGGYVNGGGSYAYGTTATLTATANEHYHFVKWNDGNTENPRVITVIGDETYTAVFAVNSYMITVNAEGEGVVSGGGSYVYKTTATLTATANEHYHFVKWNDGNTENPRAITVIGDETYTAEFAVNSYTITATAGMNGSVSPLGETTIEHGGSVTYEIVANDGYAPITVLVDGISVGAVVSYTFDNVNTNHTIHAEFTLVGVDEIAGYNANIFSYIRMINISINTDDDMGYEIIDVSGRIVRKGNFNLAISIDMEHSGMYIVRIVDDKNKLIALRKVVIR